MSFVPSGFDSAAGSNPQSSMPNDPYGPGAPKKSSLLWLWILLGLLVGGGVLAAVCCGGFAMFGMGAASTAMGAALSENAVVQEHIGSVDTCSWNFSQSFQQDNPELVAFDIEGPKGKGTVRGKLNPDQPGFESGTLTTAEGDFDLFPAEVDTAPPEE